MRRQGSAFSQYMSTLVREQHGNLSVLYEEIKKSHILKLDYGCWHFTIPFTSNLLLLDTIWISFNLHHIFFQPEKKISIILNSFFGKIIWIVLTKFYLMQSDVYACLNFKSKTFVGSGAAYEEILIIHWLLKWVIQTPFPSIFKCIFFHSKFAIFIKAKE